MVIRHRKAKTRSRHSPGKMNKTESRFAQYLSILTAAKEIRDWRFEPIKLRLTDTDWKTTLTLDFLIVRLDDTIELTDIKGGGGWEDDARVKIKIAADRYPWWWFTAHTEGPRDTWTREDFG